MLLVSLANSQSLPSEPEKYFDFWLGKWEVTWEEGNGKTGSGTNHITKILDGTAIKEEFQILKGQSKGFKGTSISSYHKRFNTWKQAWADNQNNFYYFTGKIDGNKRIFQTDIFPMNDGKEFTQRMVFYNIKQNSFTWDWQSSTDGGKNWKLNWRIQYKRIE
jgi:hypothetical protein